MDHGSSNVWSRLGHWVKIAVGSVNPRHPWQTVQHNTYTQTADSYTQVVPFEKAAKL